MVRIAVCLTVSVALFSPLAYYLTTRVRVSAAEAATTAERFTEPSECRPEPGERLAFLVGLVCVPGVAGLCCLAGRRWENRLRRPWPRAIGFILEVAAAVALLLLCRHLLTTPSDVLLRRSLAVRSPRTTGVIALLLVAASAAYRRRHRVVEAAVHLLVVAVLSAVLLVSLYTEDCVNASLNHFSAVFYAAVQVHAGKTLLIDGNSQYGLYAQFLQPLFGLIGLSVFKFTLVMGLLTLGAYLLLWDFLCRTARNRLVAALGLLTLIVCHWCYTKVPDGAEFSYLDLYFQYIPIRFIFPAALVALGAKYFQAPTATTYWFTTMLVSVGVLWNLDSGVPAYCAWLGSLCFAEFLDHPPRAAWRNCARHAGVGLLALAATVGAYAAALALVRGDWPHFSQLFKYQQRFFVAGYYMLPMPFPGAWVLVVLIYGAGLVHALFAWRDRRGDSEVRAIFLVSVLGLGLFAYYQGRSHDGVLALVWWPAFLLLTLFVDAAVVAFQHGSCRPVHALTAAFLLWGMTGYAAVPLADWKPLASWVCRQSFAADQPAGASVRRSVEFLNVHTSPADELLILSDRDALLYLASGRFPLGPSSVSEMVHRDDFAALRQLLDQKPAAKVFVELCLPHSATRPTMQRLLDGYEVVAGMEHGYLLQRAPQPCSSSPPLLKPAGPLR